MAKQASIQTNFSGGEWSLEAQGRYDLETYPSALALCRNALTTETGAWTRRPGTAYAGHTRRGLPAKILAYDFESDAPYQLEFTDNALRFREGAAFVFDAEASVSSVSTTGVVTTTAAHGFATGDEVQFADLGVVGPELHGRQFEITVSGSTTFSLIDPVTQSTVALATAVSVGTVKRMHRVATPYTSGSWSRLISIQTDKSAVFLNGEEPQVLTPVVERSDGVAAQFELEAAFFKDGPYLDPVTGGTLATPSAKLGIVQITLSFNGYSSSKAYAKGDYVTYSSVNYKSLKNANANHQPDISATWWEVVQSDDVINDGDGLQATDVGRLVRFYSEPALWAAGTAYTAGNTVTHDGTYWTAKGSSTGKVPGTDTTNWELATNAARWTWGRIVSLNSVIASSDGTRIGTLTSGAGLVAAFDDVVGQSASACAQAMNANATTLLSESFYIGKNFSASPKQIYSATIFPSSDYGLYHKIYRSVTGTFTGSYVTGVTATVYLRAKASAPTSATDGTIIGQATITDRTQPVTIMSTDTVTAWDYVWFDIEISAGTGPLGIGSDCTISVSEVQFYETPSASSNGFSVEILGEDLLYTTAIRTWRMGLYSAATGYPACGTWYEGRLWLSGVAENRIDASKANDPFNFAPTEVTGAVSDNDAISYSFNAPDRAIIYWMVPTDFGLVCGTKHGEWVIRATQANAPLTPTSIQAHRDTRGGCSNVPPVICEHSAVYVQNERRKLMEHFSDSYSGKFTAPNLAAKARHLTKGLIAGLAYQREKVPIVWLFTDDGALRGVTYKRDVMTTSAPPTLEGWHRHDLGSGRIVESLCVGPSANGSLNSLGLVTSDGSVRHVEIMTELMDEDDAIGEDWLVDSGVRPSASQEVTVSGLTGMRYYGLHHLEGEQVDVYAGGLDLGTFTVSAGAVFCPYTATFTRAFAGAARVVVGYSFVSQGRRLRGMLPADIGSPYEGLGVTRRNHAYAVQLVRSAPGATIGETLSAQRPMLLKNGKNAVSTTELYSGVHYDSLDGTYSLDGQITWQVTRPLPLTIAALSGFLDASAR